MPYPIAPCNGPPIYNERHHLATQPQKQIECFENRNPDRHYAVSFECPEFTCVCPKTGQPDFATIRIRYVPDLLCVELKSLKLYLWSFRDLGIFHEDVVNEIADQLKELLKPRALRVEGDFMVRGGIHTVVEVTFGESGLDGRNP